MSMTEEDVEPELCQINRPYSPLAQRSETYTPGSQVTKPTPPPGTSTPPLSSQLAAPSIPHPRVEAIRSEGRKTQKRRRAPAQNTTEQQLLDIITQPTTTASPHIPTHEDEMYYFVLSLVPKLNRLQPRNRNRAQLHILSYLTDLEEEENQQAIQALPVFTDNQPVERRGFQPFHPTPSSQEPQTLHTQHHLPSPPTSFPPHRPENYPGPVYHTFQ